MSCPQLSQVARCLPVLIGRGAPLGERIQATATETTGIDTNVREGLRRLEWVCSKNALLGQVLWYCFVTCASAEPDAVAMVFLPQSDKEEERKAHRLQLWCDARLSRLRDLAGRELVNKAIALWDQCPTDYQPATHRDLTGFIQVVDQRTNEATRHLTEIRDTIARRRAKNKAKRRAW
jgi:hypothetical protein